MIFGAREVQSRANQRLTQKPKTFGMFSLWTIEYSRNESNVHIRTLTSTPNKVNLIIICHQQQ